MAKLLQKTEMLRWNVREGRSWESSVSFICPSSSMGGSSFCSSEGSSTGSDHSSPNVWFQLRPSPPAASRGWPCPMACPGRKRPSRVPAGRRRQPRHPARPKGRKPVTEHFIQRMNNRFDSTDKFKGLNLRRISFRVCLEEMLAEDQRVLLDCWDWPVRWLLYSIIKVRCRTDVGSANILSFNGYFDLFVHFFTTVQSMGSLFER